MATTKKKAPTKTNETFFVGSDTPFLEDEYFNADSIADLLEELEDIAEDEDATYYVYKVERVGRYVAKTSFERIGD